MTTLTLADQEHYIHHCNKPFWYNCHELSSCLQFMNKMMSLFLGANDMPPFTQQDLKNIYFKMMPIEWQHAFINNGHDITSPNYTFLNLQQYMGTQETLHCTLTQTHHSHHSQSHNQNQHEHSPNNPHHQPDENNHGPHHQCFCLNHYNNGTACQLQHHPYHHNTANNNHAPLNNHGQQPDCNRHSGYMQLPPPVLPPKCPTTQ